MHVLNTMLECQVFYLVQPLEVTVAPCYLVIVYSIIFVCQVNSTMVGSTGSDEVTSMLSSFRGLPITLMIARASPTPTKPTQRRRAILKLQSRVSTCKHCVYVCLCVCVLGLGRILQASNYSTVLQSFVMCL